MKLRRTKILILLSLLVFSILWNSQNYLVNAETDLSPKLVSIKGENYPEDYKGIIFDNGTLITVEYSVDRFAGIDGVVLVGYGSNLTVDLTHALKLNYSRSYRDRSYYVGSFNLTENTRFKAYAWIGTIDNGTYEELESFNHLGAWHYLYTTNNPLPPRFYTISNAVNSETNSKVYTAKENANITIYYVVPNGNITDDVTLAYSVSRDTIYNSTITNFSSANVHFIKMVFENNDTGTGYPIFRATITLFDRTIYFAANNSYGWDSWVIEGSSKILTKTVTIYQINNGFYFVSEPTIRGNYTNVDDVELKIYAYNSTPTETFGIGYYVIQSKTNKTKIINWEEKNATLVAVYNKTSEEGYNTSVREYICNIGKFDIGNVIYYEAYNIYHGEFYNETNGDYHQIEIYDAAPHITLNPPDLKYFNTNNVTFSYQIDLARGNITGILIDFGDGNIANLTDNNENSTYHLYPEGVTSIYNVTLYVNSSLGTTNNITHQICLDFEKPTINLTYPIGNLTTTTGYAELHFYYTDNIGIKRVWVYWGDGTVANATGDHFAKHVYLSRGNYSVTVEVADLAGNTVNVSITINVALPIETTPNPSSVEVVTPILAIIVISSLSFLKRKKSRM